MNLLFHISGGTFWYIHTVLEVIYVYFFIMTYRDFCSLVLVYWFFMLVFIYLFSLWGIVVHWPLLYYCMFIKTYKVEIKVFILIENCQSLLMFFLFATGSLETFSQFHFLSYLPWVFPEPWKILLWTRIVLGCITGLSQRLSNVFGKNVVQEDLDKSILSIHTPSLLVAKI